MPARRLTDQDVLADRAHARVARLGVIAALAQERGVSISTESRAISGATYKHLNPISPPVPVGHRPALLDEEVAHIARMIAEGTPPVRAARKYGISVPTLRRLLARLGEAA